MAENLPHLTQKLIDLSLQKIARNALILQEAWGMIYCHDIQKIVYKVWTGAWSHIVIPHTMKIEPDDILVLKDVIEITDKTKSFNRPVIVCHSLQVYKINTNQLALRFTSFYILWWIH